MHQLLGAALTGVGLILFIGVEAEKFIEYTVTRD